MVVASAVAGSTTVRPTRVSVTLPEPARFMNARPVMSTVWPVEPPAALTLATGLTMPESDRFDDELPPVPPSDRPDRFAASAMKPHVEPSRPLLAGARRMGSLPVAQGAAPALVSQVGSMTLP